ncbi:MAG TPA: hypothetical protein VNF75_06930 [Candidatus Dormibacteraeota bacterium]|nr:hypothetical protein [Candidatus Dormibacteraeota bacterium]
MALASLISLAGGTSPTVLGASVAHTALINADSVTTSDGITSGGTAISLEQYAAEQAGFTVTVVTGTQWDAMTAAQFAQYQVLIVGDPFCGTTPTSATSDASTWAPVVMGKSVSTVAGNRVVVGTDPEFHYLNGGGGAPPTTPGVPTTSGAEHLVQDGIAYAGAVTGATGVYFDTSCATNSSDVSVLNSLSSTGTGFSTGSPTCSATVGIIAANPAFSTLTDANIEGWGCSAHVDFPTYPVDWQPLAITEATGGPTCGTDVTSGASVCGDAYVLTAGAGLVVTAPNLSLSPTSHSDTVGGSHSVTATVTQSGSPASGDVVSFTLTGQNSGVTGTCVPTNCTTGAAGTVTFTYSDVNGAGTDTIVASVTLSGSTQHATASETWTPATTVAATIPVPNTGSGGSGLGLGLLALILGLALMAASGVWGRGRRLPAGRVSPS